MYTAILRIVFAAFIRPYLYGHEKKLPYFLNFFVSVSIIYISNKKSKDMATTITKKNKEMTLLQAIERVVELAEDSKMSK